MSYDDSSAYDDSDLDDYRDSESDDDATDLLDEYGDPDAAYESYRDDQLAALFTEGDLELRKEATDRIRQRICAVSPTYLSLVTSELAQADIHLNANDPDLVAAFFHAYRSLDGYLEAVIFNPISEELVKPLAAVFVKDKLNKHRGKVARFLGSDLRNPLLRHICSSDSVRDELMKQIQAFDAIKGLRNGVVHGFDVPSREEVERCQAIARRAADLIEAERMQSKPASA